MSIPQEIAVGTYFYAWQGIRTTPIFLLADGKVSWLILLSLVSLLSGGPEQPENTCSLSLRLNRSGMRKPKKDKHQH